MNNQAEDSELERLFREERRSAEAAAPHADILLSRLKRRRPAGRPSVGRAALVLAPVLILAVGALFLRSRAHRADELPAAAARLASWKAPTDALLWTSDLWKRIPVLAPRAPAPGLSLEPAKGVER